MCFLNIKYGNVEENKKSSVFAYTYMYSMVLFACQGLGKIMEYNRSFFKNGDVGLFKKRLGGLLGLRKM